jgi:hypothetical protein
MEVYRKAEQEMLMMLLLDVDEVMYHAEEKLVFVSIVVENLYDYSLKFEALEYNHHWHIEAVYDHYYLMQMHQHHTRRTK